MPISRHGSPPILRSDTLVAEGWSNPTISGAGIVRIFSFGQTRTAVGSVLNLYRCNPDRVMF
jgi:hypothetical protein